MDRAYDALPVLAASANHAFCSLYQLKAVKLAVSDATETTVAAEKSADSPESDCDTVHITHLLEHVWMWADIVRRRQLL